MFESQYTAGPACSSTRGVTMGCYNDAITGTCDFITMASQGKSVRFGDLSTVHMGTGGASNSIKGFQLGGQQVSNGDATNIIDSMVIATGGTLEAAIKLIERSEATVS